MIAYYGYGAIGREFFYIPGNLAGMRRWNIKNSRNSMYFSINPDLLNRLESSFDNSPYLRLEELDDNGWIIDEIEIDDKELKEFRDLCFKCDDAAWKTKAFNFLKQARKQQKAADW